MGGRHSENAVEFIGFQLTNSSYGQNRQKWRRQRKFDMDEHEYRRLVIQTLEIIVADLTALNAAIAANTQATTDITAAFTTFRAEVAAGGADQASVDAATKQISDNTAALEAIKST